MYCILTLIILHKSSNVKIVEIKSILSVSANDVEYGVDSWEGV